MSNFRLTAQTAVMKAFRCWVVPALVAAVTAMPCVAGQDAQKGDKANADQQQPGAAAVEPLPPPPAIENLKAPLVPDLRTIPVAHDRTVFNVQLVDASLIPRDKAGIWVLDFAFKSLRIKTVEIPGKGRRQVHYLYYKVTNRTGKPRMFVPEFIMVNEQGQKFPDNVIPQAVPLIQAREDSSIPAAGGRQHHGDHPAQHQAGRRRRGFRRRDLGQVGPEVRPVQHFCARAFGWLQGGPIADGREADRQVQDAQDRFHPARRRAESEREGNRFLNDPPYEWVYW